METIWMTASLTGTMAVINVFGTVSLKFSAEPNKQSYFIAGIVAYTISAFIYVALLKEHSLAVLAVASTTLQLGLMVSLSVWLFDERINVVQGSAMFVAVVSASIAMLAAAH